MTRVCGFILVVSVIAAFSVIIISVQSLPQHSAQVNVARVVTGFLMLLLSMGIIKLIVGYHGPSRKGATTEVAADRLLNAKSTDQMEAFRVYYDYHLARAVGPIIPTWVWRLRRRKLQEVWAHRRNGNPGAP
jgi:hypothetical protein